MASDLSFVEAIADQAGLGPALTFRKMFGEYALYVRGKVVAFVCDNQLYLKPTPEGKAFLGATTERPPYPGGKNHYLLGDEIDDRDRLRRALLVTEAALPAPAVRRPAARTSSAKAAPPRKKKS